MKKMQKKAKEAIKKIKRNVDDLTLPEQQKRRAIAVKYDIAKDKAPKIVAIGKGRVADMILGLAEAHRIPFYEDESLVQLLSKLDINIEIPREYYTVIAEILAFVYNLEKLKNKGKTKSKAKT